MAFAERITAIKTPRILDVEGFFFSYWWCSMRSPERLNQVRSLPCVKCGNPESQAAHSNFAEHGKGRGIKASDKLTIPLCLGCHQWLDQYHSMSRDESKVWFDHMLIKTNRMLSQTDKEVF